MNSTIKKFAGSVQDAFQLSSPLLLEAALQQVSTQKDAILEALVKDSSVKVPIVGDFNAGKSSMLNRYLGREELLSTNITPETAVAYELYYSDEERVELVRAGEKIAECPLDQIKELQTQAGDIAKVYVDSPKIKSLAERGITLVDMPGIDSGVEEHNAAITNYIEHGTIFVLLVDIAGGSLRQSTLSFVSELSQYNLKPAVLVSKCDKKPASEIASVVEYIDFQATKALGSQPFVGKIASHDGDVADFERFLEELDADALLEAKYKGRVSGFLDLQTLSLDKQSQVYSADIQGLQEKAQQLEAEKASAIQKVEQPAMESSADTTEKSTQDILDLVQGALYGRRRDIAQMYVNKASEGEISSTIQSYIRPVLINAFQEEAQQYAEAMHTVVDNVTLDLKDKIKIEGNIFDNLIDSNEDWITTGFLGGALKLIAGAHPITRLLGLGLQLVSSLVPGFLKSIFGKSDDDVLGEVMGKFGSQIIPDILSRLRPSILEQVISQQERIRSSMAQAVGTSIDNIHDSMMASAGASDRDELEAKVQAIKSAVDAIAQIKASL